MDVIQKIFVLLPDFLPNGWKRLAFLAEYSEGSFCMKYYTQCGDGEYQDCYSLGIPRKDLNTLFLRIHSLIKPVRAELKDKWTVMTLLVNDDGSFKVDYDYSDLTGRTLKYHDEWEKKYLH